ncbi:hypothetical protein BSG1_07966 [Bacillus sp. SG-1]|nr:hypothetical protein BSG1_07966 [Bacillus sp. SG-1]
MAGYLIRCGAVHKHYSLLLPSGTVLLRLLKVLP